MVCQVHWCNISKCSHQPPPLLLSVRFLFLMCRHHVAAKTTNLWVGLIRSQQQLFLNTHVMAAHLHCHLFNNANAVFSLPQPDENATNLHFLSSFFLSFFFCRTSKRCIMQWDANRTNRLNFPHSARGRGKNLWLLTLPWMWAPRQRAASEGSGVV